MSDNDLSRPYSTSCPPGPNGSKIMTPSSSPSPSPNNIHRPFDETSASAKSGHESDDDDEDSGTSGGSVASGASLRVPKIDMRGRSPSTDTGSAPSSPKSGKGGMDSPKLDKKGRDEGLKGFKRLSQKITKTLSNRSSKGSTVKNQTVSHYVNVLKKKTLSRIDMIALQEDLRTQNITWLQKFDEEGVSLLEAFLTHLAQKDGKSENEYEIQSETIKVVEVLWQPNLRNCFKNVATPELTYAVLINIETPNKPIKQQTLEFLYDLCVEGGYDLVVEALTNLQKVKSNSSKFSPLVGCLIGDNTPARVLAVINAIINGIEDLEKRFEVRNEIGNCGLTQTLQEIRNGQVDGDLQIQLEAFEEGAGDDYHLMVTRKKNIRSFFQTQRDNSVRPKHYFRVFVASTGGLTVSAVVPFAETTDVKKIIQVITNKHPVHDVSQYGLFVEKETGERFWLDEEKLVMKDYNLAGEVLSEFKMKEWSVNVKVPTLNIQDKIEIDPYSSAGTIISNLLKRFNITASEEYGLYLDTSGGQWLEENKQILTYTDISKQRDASLELKPKPKAIKIKFADGTSNTSYFHPTTTAKQLLQDLSTKNVNIASAYIHDYGVYYENNWLDEEKTLVSYGLQDGSQVSVVPRPQPITVVLSDKTEKVVSVHYSHPVKDAIKMICEALKIENDGYSLKIPSTRGGLGSSSSSVGSGSTLDDWKTLRDQGISSNSADVKVLLKKDKNKKPVNDTRTETEVNIWDEPEGNIIFSDRKDKKDVAAATINKLIEFLTSSEDTDFDTDFSKTFLITYRSFMTSEQVIKKLRERWNVPPNHPKIDVERTKRIRFRICAFIGAWCTATEPADTLIIDQLLAFTDTLISEGEKTGNDNFNNIIAKLKKDLDQKKSAPKQKVYTTQGPAPPVITPKVPTITSICDIDEEECARQLTLPLWEMYSKIKPTELFNQAWNNPKLKQTQSPNLNAVIEYFNRVAAWTGNIIIREDTLNGRAKVMKHLIMISHHLCNIHNYHCMTAIISGLSNSAILRLKWTRLKLPKHIQKIYEELENLTNMEGSYRNFRKMLEHAVLPCIPYVGVYLGDLTFIEDGNPDMRDYMINWEKRKLIFTVLSNQIQKFQLVAYNYRNEESIQKFLFSGKSLNDKEMYTRSLELEPRNATRADIK